MVYSVSTQDNSFKISKKNLEESDFVELSSGTLHFIHNGQSFLVHLLAVDLFKKEIRIRINDQEKTISIEDQLDATIHSMGLEQTSVSKSRDFMAPMPGLVLDVNVKPGDSVQKGDAVLVLEAMKMENILRADGNGVVKVVHCAKGDKVEKGQLLIEME